MIHQCSTGDKYMTNLDCISFPFFLVNWGCVKHNINILWTDSKILYIYIQGMSYHQVLNNENLGKHCYIRLNSHVHQFLSVWPFFGLWSENDNDSIIVTRGGSHIFWNRHPVHMIVQHALCLLSVPWCRGSLTPCTCLVCWCIPLIETRNGHHRSPPHRSCQTQSPP